MQMLYMRMKKMKKKNRNRNQQKHLQVNKNLRNYRSKSRFLVTRTELEDRRIRRLQARETHADDDDRER
jgi:hypothetical protein